MASRILVVGLGNPGRDYQNHRHNVGFMVLEEVARRAGVALDQRKFLGRFATAEVGGRSAALLLPETFMNVSGRSVSKAAGFYGVAPADMIVVHDELDLPFSRVK